MTENEAVKEFNKMIGRKMMTKNGISEKEHELFQIAMDCLEEIQEYRAIGKTREIKEVIQFLSLDNDNTIIKKMEELNKYKFIGTIEQFREAMEKQEAKQYKVLKPCKSVNYYQCPVCDGLLHINENFCGNCGQAISWEESEEQQK